MRYRKYFVFILKVIIEIIALIMFKINTYFHDLTPKRHENISTL